MSNNQTCNWCGNYAHFNTAEAICNYHLLEYISGLNVLLMPQEKFFLISILERRIFSS